MFSLETQRQIEFEWQISEERWGPLVAEVSPALPASPTGKEQLFILKVLRGLLLVALITSLARGASITSSRYELLRIRAAIGATLALENEALRNDDRHAYGELVADQRAVQERASWLDPWRIRARRRGTVHLSLASIARYEELLQANIRVTPPLSHWTPVPYLETRFYRQVGKRWMRVDLPTSYWGELQTIETEHLRFEFYTIDAAAVQQAAPQVALLAVTLAQTLGLPWTEAKKLEFIVEPRTVSTLASSGLRLGITSPSLYRIPVTTTPSEQIIDSVLGHLANRGLNEALSVTELYGLPHWYIVIMGVRSWLLTDVLERPPYWREVATQQLAQILAKTPTLSLMDLTTHGQLDPELRNVRFFAVETLIRYAMQTYGEDQLQPLLAGLQTHDSWETLIPNVFGVSVEEFMMGWNKSLDKQ